MILSVPTGRVDVENEAIPLVRFTVPTGILPFMKVMVPVGMLPCEEVTLAVRVSLRLQIELVALLDSSVVVVVCEIVSVMIWEEILAA